MSARSGLGRLAAVAAVALAALGLGALPASAVTSVTGSLAVGTSPGTVDLTIDSVTEGPALVVTVMLDAGATCPDAASIAGGPPSGTYYAASPVASPTSLTIDSEFVVYSPEGPPTTLPYGDYQVCAYWLVPIQGQPVAQIYGSLGGLEATIGVPEPTTTSTSTSTTAAPTTTTTEAAAAAPVTPRYTG